MNEIMLAGFIPQGSEWLLILLVVLLLFGGSKLPQLAKALGQSKRAFREGQDDAEEEARREKGRKDLSGKEPATLSAVDDEALFEEARRRAAATRAADTGKRD
ncbi:MAG TPA: twin-arginine translocase TatA/TatE family subunit [Pyrinomonadaceae bacterium]|jgi:sec-independent protein translocase protein TatA